MRIWVTGIGVISPLAPTAAETMDRLLAGERGFRELELFEMPGARSQIAAQVSGLDLGVVGAVEAASVSRTDAMAVVAARQALRQAGISSDAAELDAVLGGTTAGMFETEGILAEMARDPEALAPRPQMLSHPLSATLDRMRTAVAPFRRVRTLCSACSSGANAILLAAAWIRSGRSERVLAGGADGLCRLTYAGFSALGALSPEACRPFDERRKGLTLGEAAAFLVLESAAAAQRRGAEPIVELRGWAVGSEGHHITNPEPSGETAARVMQQALACAGLEPADVDYVNAHGTATQHNDPMEARALARCFGAEIDRIWVSSSKGQLGHTLGAAGALEAAITALAISAQQLPPTVGLERVDPSCRLRHVREGTAAPVRAAISNSFGFGGTDTVLVFASPEATAPLAAPSRRTVYVTGTGTVGPLGTHSGIDGGEYLAPGPPLAQQSIEFDAAAHLDLGRARRIDRVGRFVTAAAQEALRCAGVSSEDSRVLSTAGAIVGSAFGSVDATSAYVDRVMERGARYASPAIFPNLVPSSPVAHGSIYLGLRGPVFSSFDLGATAEGAMVTAIELLAVGEGTLIAAGSAEESSPITERVLAPVCSGTTAAGVRAEGAAIVVFETAEAFAQRCADDRAGRRPLAEVRWYAAWRGEQAAALADLPAPQARAIVVLGQHSEHAGELLDGSSWSSVDRRSVAERAGFHEGAGGFAMAAAAAWVADGRVDAALVLGVAPDRGYAVLLHKVDDEADSPR